MTAPVAIVMGSQSDWPTMRLAAEILEKLKKRREGVAKSIYAPKAPAAAAALGGGPAYVFRTVTLPALRPALVSAATALSALGATQPMTVAVFDFEAKEEALRDAGAVRFND